MKIIIISQKVRGHSAWTFPFSKEGNICKTNISESVHVDHCTRSTEWFWMQTAAVSDSPCVNQCQGTRVPWFLWTHLHTHLLVLQLWNQLILTCMCPVGLKDCIHFWLKLLASWLNSPGGSISIVSIQSSRNPRSSPCCFNHALPS